MIVIKNKHAIECMSQAGKILATMLEEMKDVVKVGVSTEYIDSYIANYISKHSMISCTKGYMGYKHSSCVSVNDEVVHGVPGSRKLADGDLVKIDVCASYNGYCADMARPFFVGTVKPEIHNLVNVAQASLDAGIAQAVVNNRLTDISAAIQKVIDSNKYGIVREFAGHGIGKKMHEDPEILNYGKAGCGPTIKAGMAFAIEPMITAGSHKIYIDNDGWTVRTQDKSFAAHVEDTVVVTDNGPLIITRL